MAKKKAPGVPNRHLYTRISFLYQAATYLAIASKEEAEPASKSSTTPQDAMKSNDGSIDGGNGAPRVLEQLMSATAPQQNMSRKILTDMRAVTLKAQIRISPDIKRTICKHCDTLLIDGQTCSSTVENTSKGGKKPWADVLVIRCHTCSREKRFPVSAQRQKRRPHRISSNQLGLSEKSVAATDLVLEQQDP